MNKLEPWYIIYIMQQVTKPSNLHLIDRLQFPWLIASNGLWLTPMLTKNTSLVKKKLENIKSILLYSFLTEEVKKD